MPVAADLFVPNAEAAEQVGTACAALCQSDVRLCDEMPTGLLAITGASAAAYVGNKAVTTATPQIFRIEPSSVRPGRAVTIQGTNLIPAGSDPGKQPPTVTVNDLPAAVISASPSAVTVRIPVDAPISEPGSPATVVLIGDAGGRFRAQSTLVVLRDAVVLTQLVPATAAPGDVVTLIGRGFLNAAALPPADDVAVDPPLVVLGVTGTGVAARELARVSASDAHDTRLTFTMPAVNADPATRLSVIVMRGSLTSDPLSMLLATAPAPPSEAGPLRPSKVDATQGFALGVGVATISGVRLGTAVSFTEPKPVQVWAQETKISLCATSEQVYSALDISVDTAASYGVASFSDKFGLAQSCDRLAYSLYLVVRATKYSPLTVPTDVALNSRTQQTPNLDPQGFVRQYGDKYVSGIVKGGEFAAVLAINTSSEEIKQQITNSLAVSAEAGELSASVQNNVTQTLNKHSSQLHLTILTSIRGGAPNTVPVSQSATSLDPAHPETATGQDVAGILTAARTFPDTVTDQNAWPLTAQLADYYQLPGASELFRYIHSDRGLDGPFMVLAQLSLLRRQLVAQLGRVSAVLANPFGYVEPGASVQTRFTDLRAQLQEAIERLDRDSAEYADQVAGNGGAAGTVSPDTSRYLTKTVTWPTRPALPAYRIRPVDQKLYISAPTTADNGSDPSAPARQPTDSPVLAEPHPDDPRQQWLIPDLGTGRFTMQNAATRLYAANINGESTPLVQTADPTTANAQWTLFDNQSFGMLGPAISGNIVSSIADGRVLNALGDHRGRNTLIGVYHLTWEPNSQWLFERVEPAEKSPPTT